MITTMEPHWYTFTAATLFLIGLIGGTVNLLVVILIFRNRQLWNRQNILILTLACADLTMSIGGVVFPLISAIHHEWIFGDVACEIYAFATSFVGIGAIATLTVLAFDRVQTVRRPSCRSSWTDQHPALCILSVWIFAFAVTSPPLFGWGRYVPEGPGLSCSVDWESTTANSISYIVFLMVVGFVIPVCVIFSSYAGISATLKQATIDGHASSGVSRAEFRVNVMLAVMVIGYLVAWLPYTLVAIFKIYASLRNHAAPLANMKSMALYAPALLAKSSIIYNPIIYSVFNTQFRAAWRDLFRCGCHQNANVIDTEGNPKRTSLFTRASIVSRSPSSVVPASFGDLSPVPNTAEEKPLANALKSSIQCQEALTPVGI